MSTLSVQRFNIAELFSNSKGKTSISLVCAFILIMTGCSMGLRGAFVSYADSMLQGLAFAGLGCGLLGIRRFTQDKPVSPEADSNEKS